MIALIKTKNTLSDQLFKWVHNSNLIYNTSWEDPKIDRQLLNLNANSRVLMITGAGCNTLDYLLDSPAHIDTVDINYRQNALLHLKMALIKHGTFEDLFAMFGQGYCTNYHTLYQTIKNTLPKKSQKFWDEKIHYFSPHKKYRKSFYNHGTTGLFAWLVRQSLFLRHTNLSTHAQAFIEANTLPEQNTHYSHIEPAIYTRTVKWLLKQPITLALLGVPKSQIQLIQKQYLGGLNQYFEDKTRYVATQLSINQNYFWRVYFTGSYNHTCCPNYLKQENFHLLRKNMHKIQTHTNTLIAHLKNTTTYYTHFILLDHQDWLATHNPHALKKLWQHILNHSQKGTKILMRSAGINAHFIPQEAQSKLQFFPQKTTNLHQQDRVGTYGSLHLAQVL